MKRHKGIVKDKVIVLEEGVVLPDGTEVEVRLASPEQDRDEVFRRVLQNQITHYVGMAEIIEEDKKERDVHWDHLWSDQGAQDARPEP